MIKLSRFHATLAFIALMLLRVVVGYHFFKEGTDKLSAGNFSAESFLRTAKGPLGPHFQGLLDDGNGALRFCLTEDAETKKKAIDPELTFAIWDDFLDRATGHFRFGDKELQQELASRRDEVAAAIQKARDDKDANVDTKELEAIRAEDERTILLLRQQAESGEAILEAHVDELTEWINVNRAELLAYFETADRVDGFERDGESKKKVVVHVESLREQVDSIVQDRHKQMKAWAANVGAIWDSYESQILALTVDRQADKMQLELHRPFAQKQSKLQWLNRIIPWFDTIVGALLILGLFTRLASLAGATFLASIIATQPPWIPGTAPTYLYSVELIALLVIFATLAGQLGGLDFFFARSRKSNVSLEEANDDQSGLDLA